MKITNETLKKIIKESIEELIRRKKENVNYKVVNKLQNLLKKYGEDYKINEIPIKDLIKCEINPNSIFIKNGEDYLDKVNDILDKIKNNEIVNETTNNNKLLSLKELKEKYPEMIFKMNESNKIGPTGEKTYYVSVYIKTQNNNEKYLAGIKGWSSFDQALNFFNEISKREYDKYY